MEYSRANTGFKLGKSNVSHLLYIDDLKLNAQDEEEALRCKQFIQKCSDGIGVRFGLGKCVVLTIRKGKVVPTALMEDIPRLDHEEGYKYLGILESSDFLTQKVKDTTTKEYYSSVRKICKVHLSGHTMMTAICAFVVPVTRYTCGVLKRNKGELASIDQNIRKSLTQHGLHHLQANFHCLYLH
eukprot:496516-Ditylum_brightwellii.AAC.1